ncbi:sensor histidine kinase [Candidatus Neomarinimicrobiota bacterium]
MNIFDKQSKIGYKKLAIHCGSWCATYLFIIFILVAVESYPINWSIKLALYLVITAAVPTYLHFYIWNKYFNREDYLLYIILVIATICLSALIAYNFFTAFYEATMYFIAWCIDIVFVLVFTSALKIVSNGLSERFKMQEIRAKNLESELQLLKGQMNPHFYFNTLNNLYSLSLEKSEKVPETIVKLSEIMRYILESSKKEKVKLDEEITYLNNYLSLERLRSEDEDVIRFETKGIWEGKYISPMILIQFAENCVKHGMVNSSKGWFININLTVDDNKLTFSTENRINTSKGNGINSTSPKVGLKNVKKQLKLLYPDKHQLTIRQDEINYKVLLEIYL